MQTDPRIEAAARALDDVMIFIDGTGEIPLKEMFPAKVWEWLRIKLASTSNAAFLDASMEPSEGMLLAAGMRPRGLTKKEAHRHNWKAMAKQLMKEIE